MATLDYKEIFERIDFNERKIRETLSDIEQLRLEILTPLKFNEDLVIDVIRSEKFRIQLALEYCKYHRGNTAILLDMSVCSLCRKIIEYELHK